MLGTGASYTVKAADVGLQIIVRETAVNTGGTVTKDSLATSAVAGPPVNTVVPAITVSLPPR